jgi:hypothetical protein
MTIYSTNAEYHYAENLLCGVSQIIPYAECRGAVIMGSQGQTI